MRKASTPLYAPGTKSGKDSDRRIKTKARGLAVLNSPSLNKGSAFTAVERTELALNGLLPPDIGSLGTQVRSAYVQYERLPDSVSKNVYLTALHDRNEVLFYRLFSEHLLEMIPIVNDLTVGMAIEQYHHEFRRPRGVYLSIDHPDGIEEAFANFGAASQDIDLIIATDAEHILGIGDWGVGGIEVSIGKLAIYTAAGGIDPARSIPVMLDVGTNRQGLLTDPMYVGNRHVRIRGEMYDNFIDNYVKVVTRLFPHALLQWEDISPENARRILDKYRERICTFSDDMQGTGAITLAAAISAVRVCGTPLRNQRVVIFGAGTAGMGAAQQIRDAMIRDGLTHQEATSRFWCVDRAGLLTAGMSQLQAHQSAFARPAGDPKSGARLAEVMELIRPTVLIGASTHPGSFTEPMVRQMAAYNEHPIIFVLSRPQGRAEAAAADLIEWTDGHGLIATGCVSAPVTYKGATYSIGQLSNAMLNPGLVLGTIVSRAVRISDAMFVAAASAVSSLVAVRQPGASLLPHVNDLRSVSATVAVAVAECAEQEGLARVKLGDIVQKVQDVMWQPVYHDIEAA